MNKLIKPYKAKSNELHDESLYTDYANSHSNPTNENEVALIIKECKKINEKITVCGSLTGLNGAGVPAKGHSLCTKHLNKMSYNFDSNTIEVDTGATFEDIQNFVTLKSKGTRELPIYPTERTATIGGAISFNSSGLRSYRLGKINEYVEKITLCNQDGEFVSLSKTDQEFNDFFGSEGMLGILTSVTLKTIKKINFVWGIMFFFESDIDSIKFVNLIDKYKEIQTIEYIDKNCFNLCEKYKSTMSTIESIPKIQDHIATGIYIEIYNENEEQIEQLCEILMEEAILCNSDPDLAWAMSQEEIRKLQDYRHAIAECLNIEVAKYNNIDSRIKFVNIDIKWETKSRIEIINYYRSLFNNTPLNYYIFGHIGNNSPYVTILTKTIDEYILANKIVEICYKSAIIEKDIIFDEFGIGKLNKNIFCNSEKIESLNKKMKAKHKYDANGLFNPLNMFSSN